jgi:hypothetical protein
MQNLPFHQPGRFYKGNLHTHSTNSDGAFPVEEVIRRYRQHGYDFLAMSDHFLERYDFPVTDTTASRGDDFTTLIAAEFHVGKMQNEEIWHVLGVGLPLDFARPAEDESIVEISRRAADAGAFIGIVHPTWNGVRPEDAQILPFAHGIEIYNHGSHVENDRGDGWGLCDQLLNEGRHVQSFATDDAHLLTHDAFGGWIHVKAEDLNPDSLLQSLKAGRFYSSQGPQIHDIRVEGDEIVVECSPANGILASGRGSRGVQQLGHGLTGARLPLKKFKDGYVRIIVADERGRKAWSNAVWLQ